MRIVHRAIDRDRKGTIVMIAEENEDMWHAYNLITEGDTLKAPTIRKVHQETATGSINVSRVKTTLTICVESTDFDTQACVLRVKGRNVEENPYVKMGGYHTLDLELNRKFTIGKDFWDSVALERIENASDVSKKADLAAIIMQEGLAHICLVTSNMTLVRSKIEQNIPKKRKGMSAQYDKAIAKFYDSVITALVRHIDFDVVKCVLIASPGFVKDQFFTYMMSKASSNSNNNTSLLASDMLQSPHTAFSSPAKNASNATNFSSQSPSVTNTNANANNIDPAKLLGENRHKFLLVHSSSGFKHSLKEVLSDPRVIALTSDTKAACEIKALQSFLTMLQCDADRAYYGLAHVERANAVQAIETLLMSDTLFRSKDLTMRKKCVNLFDNVRKDGGNVHLFSSLHVSGEQLDQLTGIAAILRYPIPDIDDQDEIMIESENVII